jgi:hypothetical protein
MSGRSLTVDLEILFMKVSLAVHIVRDPPTSRFIAALDAKVVFAATGRALPSQPVLAASDSSTSAANG